MYNSHTVGRLQYDSTTLNIECCQNGNGAYISYYTFSIVDNEINFFTYKLWMKLL